MPAYDLVSISFQIEFDDVEEEGRERIPLWNTAEHVGAWRFDGQSLPRLPIRGALFGSYVCLFSQKTRHAFTNWMFCLEHRTCHATMDVMPLASTTVLNAHQHQSSSTHLEKTTVTQSRDNSLQHEVKQVLQTYKLLKVVVTITSYLRNASQNPS
jgi:hypothetical protein